MLFLACLAFGLRCVYLIFSVWFRVDSGLGRWFIAGWRAKFYLKSVQGVIRNLSKIHVPNHQPDYIVIPIIHHY